MLRITSTYPTATKVLEKWKKYVVSQARRNLSVNGTSKDGKLYTNLKGIIDKRMNRGIKGRFTGGSSLPSLRFEYPSYGEFLDQGVKGTNPEKDDYVSNGKYSFKKGKRSVKVKGNSALAKWAEKRGLNKWAVAKSVHQRGIKRTLFFTKPFKARYKAYVDMYNSAAADDIANNIAKQMRKQIRSNKTK
jgi:hypothetical protein